MGKNKRGDIGAGEKLVADLKETIEELTDEIAALTQWRLLARKFDAHRMQAMALLRKVANGQFTQAEVEEFVAAAPQDYLRPELEVWFGPMPESNGKSNYTAILKRKGEDLVRGETFVIARSEYHDQVRYDADCVRHIIGELPDAPDIMDYDPDLHSGYKPGV